MLKKYCYYYAVAHQHCQERTYVNMEYHKNGPKHTGVGLQLT